MKKDICSFTYEELKEEMASIGEKSFRAGQIYDWLHVKLFCGNDQSVQKSPGEVGTGI